MGATALPTPPPPPPPPPRGEEEEEEDEEEGAGPGCWVKTNLACRRVGDCKAAAGLTCITIQQPQGPTSQV